MSENHTVQEIIKEWEKTTNRAREWEREQMELSKYIHLLRILGEAKELAKELKEDIDNINPDFSSL